MTNAELSDPELLAEIRDCWQRNDPPPPGLAERVLAALAMEDLELDYVLLTMASSTREPTGARSAAAVDTAPLRLEFADADVSLLLRVSIVDSGHRRIDGWVVPDASQTVTVWRSGRTQTVTVGAHGRFAFARVPAGLVRLWISGPSPDSAEAERCFGTTLFEI